MPATSVLLASRPRVKRRAGDRFGGGHHALAADADDQDVGVHAGWGVGGHLGALAARSRRARRPWRTGRSRCTAARSICTQARSTTLPRGARLLLAPRHGDRRAADIEAARAAVALLVDAP